MKLGDRRTRGSDSQIRTYLQAKHQCAEKKKLSEVPSVIACGYLRILWFIDVIAQTSNRIKHRRCSQFTSLVEHHIKPCSAAAGFWMSTGLYISSLSDSNPHLANWSSYRHGLLLRDQSVNITHIILGAANTVTNKVK